MNGLNKVMIIGTLGGDPEERRLNNGNPVVNFTMATNKRWKDKDGTQQEKTEWHRIVCFNEGLCGVAIGYLKKGSRCYVSGELQTRQWEDKDGNDRYTTEIVLGTFSSELVLLGEAGGAGGNRSGDRDRARDHDGDRDNGGGRDRGNRGAHRGSGGGNGRDRDGGNNRNDRGGNRNSRAAAERNRDQDDTGNRRGVAPTSGRNRAVELDDEIPF